MARRRSEEGKQAGRRIAELRDRHHLTQEAAARLLKVGNRTYQAWESGESVPRWANRVKLGRLYGVEPQEILGPPSEGLDTALLAGLVRRVDDLEGRLADRGAQLDALQETVESQSAVRVAARAKQAQGRAPGTPRTGDRRGRG